MLVTIPGSVAEYISQRLSAVESRVALTSVRSGEADRLRACVAASGDLNLSTAHLEAFGQLGVIRLAGAHSRRTVRQDTGMRMRALVTVQVRVRSR